MVERRGKCVLAREIWRARELLIHIKEKSRTELSEHKLDTNREGIKNVVE